MNIPCYGCDKCGAEFRAGEGLADIQFFVANDTDISTGSRSAEYKYADLCHTCLRSLVAKLLHPLKLALQGDLAAEFGGRAPS